MPNAVLEAMAMGLPIISSGAGGLKDILREGGTGMIVEQRGDAPDRQRFSAEEVADRVERLAMDPDTVSPDIRSQPLVCGRTLQGAGRGTAPGKHLCGDARRECDGEARKRACILR